MHGSGEDSEQTAEPFLVLACLDRWARASLGIWNLADCDLFCLV